MFWQILTCLNFKYCTDTFLFLNYHDREGSLCDLYIGALEEDTDTKLNSVFLSTEYEWYLRAFVSGCRFEDGLFHIRNNCIHLQRVEKEDHESIRKLPFIVENKNLFKNFIACKEYYKCKIEVEDETECFFFKVSLNKTDDSLTWWFSTLMPFELNNMYADVKFSTPKVSVLKNRRKEDVYNSIIELNKLLQMGVVRPTLFPKKKIKTKKKKLNLLLMFQKSHNEEGPDKAELKRIVENALSGLLTHVSISTGEHVDNDNK
ncbi:putative SP-containing protein [Vairimorpha necatrix]|uniref:SP-containing protein n=1 Tax=Vairimorpha necatrix TaxID=6039 RepID=A0AAX4JES9_9MICR